MGQDIRKLFREAREKEPISMEKGHEERFLALLDKELPQAKKSYRNWLGIAASVAVLLGVGVMAWQWAGTKEDPIQVVEKDGNVANTQNISLGDLSPDLKKVEDYYVTTINLELSDLEISDANKDLVDSYMEQLGNLNTEYQRLNKELNEIGPNDQTITALIKNLQLRLQLLQKLKNKLNELKSSSNEQIKTNSI